MASPRMLPYGLRAGNDSAHVNHGSATRIGYGTPQPSRVLTSGGPRRPGVGHRSAVGRVERLRGRRCRSAQWGLRRDHRRGRRRGRDRCHQAAARQWWAPAHPHHRSRWADDRCDRRHGPSPVAAARSRRPDDVRCAGCILADCAHAVRHAVPAHRDALHLSRHRLGREQRVQRHAVSDQSAGGVRPSLASGLALGRHASLLRARAPERAGHQHTVNRWGRAELGPGEHRAPVVCRCGLG